MFVLPFFLRTAGVFFRRRAFTVGPSRAFRPAPGRVGNLDSMNCLCVCVLVFENVISQLASRWNGMFRIFPSLLARGFR